MPFCLNHSLQWQPASHLPILPLPPLPIFGCRTRLACDPFTVFLDYVDHWEDHSDATIHGLLVSVGFKSDEAGGEVLVIVQCPRADIVNNVQTSLQCRQRRATVEPQGLSAGHSRYPNRSPNFSSMLPLPKPRVPVNSPHLPCGAEDLISSLALAPEKEGA